MPKATVVMVMMGGGMERAFCGGRELSLPSLGGHYGPFFLSVCVGGGGGGGGGNFHGVVVLVDSPAIRSTQSRSLPLVVSFFLSLVLSLLWPQDDVEMGVELVGALVAPGLLYLLSVSLCLVSLSIYEITRSLRRWRG
jgi:hypothetical protein